MNKYQVYAFADEASDKLEGQIDAMNRNQLQGVELRNVDGQNVSDISEEMAHTIINKIKDAGLRVWAIGSPIGKIHIEKDDFEEHLEKFRHTLKLAQILECKNIRLFSFYMPEGENPDKYMEEVVRRLNIFIEIAKESQVTLCHENEKGIFGDNAERCLELHKRLPELRGVFDPANFIQCDQDTMEAWNLLKPYVEYLHIKDALADGKVVPAGEGIGNVMKIASLFLEQGGNSFTIEPHLAVFRGFEDLEEEGKESVIDPYQYESNDVAFDVACRSFKRLISEGK